MLRLRRNRKYILFALAVVEKELYGESFCGNGGKRDGVYEFGNICEQIIWFSLLGFNKLCHLPITTVKGVTDHAMHAVGGMEGAPTEETKTFNVGDRAVNYIVITDIAQLHITVFPMHRPQRPIEGAVHKCTGVFGISFNGRIIICDNAVIDVRIFTVEGVHELPGLIHHLFARIVFKQIRAVDFFKMPKLRAVSITSAVVSYTIFDLSSGHVAIDIEVEDQDDAVFGEGFFGKLAAEIMAQMTAFADRLNVYLDKSIRLFKCDTDTSSVEISSEKNLIKDREEYGFIQDYDIDYSDCKDMSEKLNKYYEYVQKLESASQE